MGKSKTMKIASVRRRNHNDELELTLSEFGGRDTFSKHRSCWRHVAASLDGVHGKVSKKDMLEIKSRFEHTSPCLSHIVYCRKKRSKRGDQGLSRPRSKMDDSTFDNHLENIWRSLSEDKRSSIAQVNSLCFSIYKRQQSKGLNIIKKEDIFSKKYVIVPVVCWDHWRLVIFCHFGEAAHSETRTRCILLLDSLEKGAHAIEPDIRKFVFDIFTAEGRPEIKDVVYQIPFLVPKVPQQRNDVDCGRFVLYFIKQFMDDTPENISISNGCPDFMEPNWFDSKKFEDFCDKLDKELPTQKRGKKVSRRLSQRIRTRITSQESSKRDMEVVTID